MLGQGFGLNRTRFWLLGWVAARALVSNTFVLLLSCFSGIILVLLSLRCICRDMHVLAPAGVPFRGLNRCGALWLRYLAGDRSG